MTEYLKNCKVGKHNYITIYDDSNIWNNGYDLIIKWCKNCGAFHKFKAIDGRLWVTVSFNTPNISKQIYDKMQNSPKIQRK